MKKHRIHISTFSNQTGKWFETPEDGDIIDDFAVSLMNKDKGKDGWYINDLDGYTYFEPDNHPLDPHSISELTKHYNSVGLAAEIFAEEFGLCNIYHFDKCYIADFDSIRDLAKRMRYKGVFKDYGFTDNTRIEIKAVKVIDILDWSTIIKDERIYLFDNMNPVVRNLQELFYFV